MTSITIDHFLFLGAILFTIGVLGIFLNKKNVIIILMSVELILLAVNINFIAFNRFGNFDTLDGHVFTIFVIVLAAAEAAVALAIIINLFKNILF